MAMLRRALAALGALALLVLAVPALAASATDAAGFVAGFVRQGADIAASHDTLDQAALEPWQRLVADSLDLKAIAAFVVGTAWSSAASGERDELVRLIGRQIAALYAHRVLADRKAALEITGSQALGSQETLVSSRLTREDGSVESIDWLVRGAAAGGFSIVDIVSNGQSLAAMKRSEYAIVLQRNRGDIASLIEALRLDRQ
jgi:ABC-type transporter MlaC component